MKLHAICLVKNESDIVVETLTEASGWCDHIYVFDNGSDDGTWERVLDLSRVLPQVEPFKSEAVPFRDSLRKDVFDAYRGRSSEGDWWCRLDADEFYVDDPRAVLSAVPAQYTVVWAAALTYYFTDRDAGRYSVDPAQFAEDVPVRTKCRYYLNHWSEPRFFRYAANLRWSRRSGGFPVQALNGRVFPQRIRQQHFQYRSPEQINKRLATRHHAIDRGTFLHEAVPEWAAAVTALRAPSGTLRLSGPPANAGLSWRDRIVPAEALDFDAHDGVYVLNEDLMPRLPRRSAFAVMCERARSTAHRVRDSLRLWSR